MNRPRPHREQAQVNPRLALVLLAGVAIPLLALAALAPVPQGKPEKYPDWWFEREVIARADPNNTQPGWPGDYLSPDDHAVLTEGQLKHLTVKAYEEIKAHYPTQPWTTGGTPAHALEQLVLSWYDAYPGQPRATGTAHQAVNQGQLKNMAKHVYDVLAAVGYVSRGNLPPEGWTSGPYPWSSSAQPPDHYAAANCGQAKYLFSFVLEGFDIDVDGLADWWETQYWPGALEAEGHDADDDPDHDGLTNAQEYERDADPGNPDTDWDGVSDGREVQEGTDPADFESYNPRRLAWLRFEEEGLAGAAGDLPRTASGIEQVAGWRSKGVRINEAGDLLAYERIRTDGAPNIALKRGSVRLWFKPEWASNQDPGSWCRFVQLGGWTSDRSHALWMLMFQHQVDHVLFGQNSGNSASYKDFSSGIGAGWTANAWHQLVLTYSPAGRKLYLDGVLVGEESSSANLAFNLEELDGSGLMVGSDGAQPVKGVMDEIEFFNYELDAAQIAADYAAQTALGADTNDNGLPDAWETENLGNLEQSAEDDPDHDGLSNLDEYERGLNPRNSDTDWDGNSDLQELADGTDPADFDSFIPRKIAHFGLDGPGFVRPSGESPRTAAGVEQVNGWKGKAARLADNGDALTYERVRSDGAPNIALKRGTVRMWIKTDWATAQMSQTWASLVILGRWTPQLDVAFWIWRFNASEPWLDLTLGDGSGYTTITYGSLPAWNAGQWVQVVVIYTPTTRTFYVNGVQRSFVGVNWNYELRLSDLDDWGLGLGSVDYEPLKGAIDEVEFFNYELSAAQIQSDYAAAVASRMDADSNGLFDAWEIEHFGATGQNPAQDEDGDGLTNAQESLFGTDPHEADTDGDGRSDAQEIAQGTDPLTPDSAPDTPGQPPTNVAVETPEPGHHEITWTNNGPAALFNTIERTGDGKTWKIVGVVGGSATSFTDETAEPDLPYFYRVGAVR